jgi:hypothetical protein
VALPRSQDRISSLTEVPGVRGYTRTQPWAREGSAAIVSGRPGSRTKRCHPRYSGPSATGPKRGRNGVGTAL